MAGEGDLNRACGRVLRACAKALLIAACWIGAAHSATIHYVYDELGRLIAEIDESGATTRYTYDPAGNLLSVARDSSTAFRVDGFAPSTGKAGDEVTIFVQPA